MHCVEVYAFPGTRNALTSGDHSIVEYFRAKKYKLQNSLSLVRANRSVMGKKVQARLRALALLVAEDHTRSTVRSNEVTSKTVCRSRLPLGATVPSLMHVIAARNFRSAHASQGMQTDISARLYRYWSCTFGTSAKLSTPAHKQRYLDGPSGRIIQGFILLSNGPSDRIQKCVDIVLPAKLSIRSFTLLLIPAAP